MNFINFLLRIARGVILGLSLLCLVLFMVDNRGEVSIHLDPFPFSIETRVFIVMIFFFLLGMAFGILLCSKTIISNAVNKIRLSHRVKN
jgi:hypothetical protein